MNFADEIAALESLMDELWEREGRMPRQDEFSNEQIQARAEWMADQREEL